MSKEIKKPTTYEEQIEILRNRGCIISDNAFCKAQLEAINYYRLTAYFLPFKIDNDHYDKNTTFQQVYRIYEFDRKLRAILFSAVEEVEVYLRSRFAYYHAHKYGATGYLSPANFSNKHNDEKFKTNIEREIESNKDVLFVKHHIEHYNSIFPIWVVFELFTFGMLSYFYNDLKTTDQKLLSNELYQTTPKNVISWLRCCTDLRNICAHYGRLYYRIFPASPAGLQMSDAAKRRLWGTITALFSLYPHPQKWNNDILPSLEALFEKYKEDINLYHLAFPHDWNCKLRKQIATRNVNARFPD